MFFMFFRVFFHLFVVKNVFFHNFVINLIINVDNIVIHCFVPSESVIDEPILAPQEVVCIWHVEWVINDRILACENFVRVFENHVFFPVIVSEPVPSVTHIHAVSDCEPFSALVRDSVIPSVLGLVGVNFENGVRIGAFVGSIGETDHDLPGITAHLPNVLHRSG